MSESERVGDGGGDGGSGDGVGVAVAMVLVVEALVMMGPGGWVGGTESN